MAFIKRKQKNLLTLLLDTIIGDGLRLTWNKKKDLGNNSSQFAFNLISLSLSYSVFKILKSNVNKILLSILEQTISYFFY